MTVNAKTPIPPPRLCRIAHKNSLRHRLTARGRSENLQSNSSNDAEVTMSSSRSLKRHGKRKITYTTSQRTAPFSHIHHQFLKVVQGPTACQAFSMEARKVAQGEVRSDRPRSIGCAGCVGTAIIIWIVAGIYIDSTLQGSIAALPARQASAKGQAIIPSASKHLHLISTYEMVGR
jgi:hypothetical protein